MGNMDMEAPSGAIPAAVAAAPDTAGFVGNQTQANMRAVLKIYFISLCICM